MKNAFVDMTPEQRLEEIKKRYYRDHVAADGRETLFVPCSDDIRPEARAIEPDENDDGSTGGFVLDGYGAVFGMDSAGMWFTEQVAQGAFRETIVSDDVVGLFNHDKNYVLGRNTARTMELSEDDTGLKYKIDLPDTSVGRDVHTSVKRGDITGSSFSFQTLEDLWEYSEDGEHVKRTILKVKLFDVGPVTFPAYPQTTVAARDMSNFIEEMKTVRHADEIPWRLNHQRRELEIEKIK